MRTKLKIANHENKTSQGGLDYTRFNTSNGWMSCFEKDVIEKCLECEGKEISAIVDVVESIKGDKTFHNIRQFHGTSETEEVEDTNFAGAKIETKDTASPRKSIKNTAYEKDPVGLAVEIFICLMNNIQPEDGANAMNGAIDLVKQAQEAFS